MFSNRKKYIQTANKEIINKMTGYLPIIDVYKLAATSRFFSSTINFAIVKSRPDYNIFENTKSENISIIIQKALTGIEVYLTQDVKRPTVGTRSGPGMDTTTDYSVGYRRATCFKDILADKEYHDRSVRILALYVLLQEFNGKQLKSRVKEQLGIRFLKMLDLYVHTKYSAEYINKIKNELLNVIHDDKHGPLANDDFHYQGVFPLGFMRSYIFRVFESVNQGKPASSRCAIS